MIDGSKPIMVMLIIVIIKVPLEAAPEAVVVLEDVPGGAGVREPGDLCIVTYTYIYIYIYIYIRYI